MAALGLACGGLAPTRILKAADDIPAASTKLNAYAFRVNSDGLVLDADGAPIAVPNVSVYLKDLNILNVTVACLWIDGPDSVKNMTPTVQAFGGTFTKIIVKKWEAGDKTGLIALPAPNKRALQAAITAAYPGRAYPKSSVGGPVEQRPAELRPGPLPPKVRYQFADNAAVENAAGRLVRHFLDSKDAAKPIWAADVIVQSGAWSLFGADADLGKKDAIHYSAKIPTLSATMDLPQVLLRKSDEIGELDSSLRRIIATEGGAKVRALRSEEEKTWWQYIPYDITEPVFVVETRNGCHRFVIGMNADGIAMVDELTGLPSLSPSPNAGGLD